MQVSGIPDTLADLEQWWDAYDREHLIPSDEAAAIERATRMLMLTRIPGPLAPLGDALVGAMYDSRLRAAMKVPTPAWPVRAGLHIGLKLRARLLRHFGRPRPAPMFSDGIVTATYPDGYTIDQLGPAGTYPADV
jgi:hypothetical protein